MQVLPLLAAMFMFQNTADFNGRWETVNDDKTEGAILELQVSGASVRGELVSIERGYFSGRETVTAQIAIRGTAKGGQLDVTLTDASGQGEGSGKIIRRGKYLIVQAQNGEHAFARPGQSLVESAAGSTEAVALERAIAGKIYSTTSQASGRGASVGGRIRIAVCANGRLEFDASNVASTPGGLPGGGVDLGSTVTRRGTWSIVMYAGAPAVRAQWQGAGTSYSLTGYFMIKPSANGKSAIVDGAELPVTGTC